MLFHQEQINRVPGETYIGESEDSSCDETERLQIRAVLPLSEESASDEDDSEYEDCQEEEEEDWQTCSEEDSGPEEEACSGDCKGNCAVGSEAQSSGTPPRRQIHNSSHLVSKQELLELFKQLHIGKKVKDGQLTVGLVR